MQTRITDMEFQHIRNLPRIKPVLDSMIPFIEMRSEERLKFSQATREYIIKRNSDLIEKLESIRGDKELCQLLSIDSKHLDWVVRFHQSELNHLKKQRSSPLGRNYLYLWHIFEELERMGYGQSKQVNFVYRLFFEYNFEDYRDWDEGSDIIEDSIYDDEKDKRPDKHGALIGEQEKKDRIRQMRKKLLGWPAGKVMF